MADAKQANVFIKVAPDGSIENIAMQQTEEINVQAIWDGLDKRLSEVHAFNSYTSKTDGLLHIHFNSTLYDNFIAEQEEKTKQEELAKRKGELFSEIADHIIEEEVESDKEGYKKTEVRLGELVLWSYYTENSSTESNG